MWGKDVKGILEKERKDFLLHLFTWVLLPTNVLFKTDPAASYQSEGETNSKESRAEKIFKEEEEEKKLDIVEAQYHPAPRPSLLRSYLSMRDISIIVFKTFHSGFLLFAASNMLTISLGFIPLLLPSELKPFRRETILLANYCLPSYLI